MPEIEQYYKKASPDKKEVTYTYVYQRIDFLEMVGLISRKNAYGSGILIKINPKLYDEVEQFVKAREKLEGKLDG